MSGEFDSRKDSCSYSDSNLNKTLKYLFKRVLSFRELRGSKLSGLHYFDNMAIIH